MRNKAHWCRDIQIYPGLKAEPQLVYITALHFHRIDRSGR